TGLVEHSDRSVPLPELHEDASHATEYARTLEAQVLAVTNARSRVAQNPAEDGASDGPPAQRRLHAPLGVAANVRPWSRLHSGARARRGAIGRPTPTRHPAHRPDEQQRVVAKRGGLELELLEAAIAERREIRVELALQL